MAKKKNKVGPIIAGATAAAIGAGAYYVYGTKKGKPVKKAITKAATKAKIKIKKELKKDTKIIKKEIKKRLK